MESTIIAEPCIQDLEFRGFIQGVTIKDKSTNRSLCRFFGGVPYAQPPVGDHRWTRPRELAPCYRYGTASSPGVFDKGCDVCPQRSNHDSNSTSEDCLQCNIWVPGGDPPSGGWPVYFFIHGGFLQSGNANEGNPVKFVSEVAQCIVVKPGYRLNIFGFLAGDRVAGNFGYWDLRMALEWTYKNINYFGGNPRNITVGGYSAGAHAAFYQLAYDLVQSSQKRLIRRLVMHSNGPSVQPKSYKEAQMQMEQLINVLDIHQDAVGKVDLLKQKPASELVKAIRRLRLHQFRAVTDDVFVRSDLFAEIANGTFGRRMKENNVKLWIGECADEHFVYARYLTPKPGLDAMSRRFKADYPREAVKSLLKAYFPTQQLPAQWKDWHEAFGKVYASLQIHVAQRGLINSLITGGAGSLIHRYRIEWRAACADAIAPRSFGATHIADMPIWWYGEGMELKPDEQDIVRRAFLDDFSRYLRGEQLNWTAQGPRQYRCLRADGRIETVDDADWDSAMTVWTALGHGMSSNDRSKL